MPRWIHKLAWLLVALLVGMILAPYVHQYLELDTGLGDKPQKESTAAATGSVLPVLGLASSFADSVQIAEPTVVEVYTSNNSQKFSFYDQDNELTPPNKGSGIGSGVIIDDEGYIVTSYHVIEGADTIIVGLHSGETVQARVIGSDPETDLSVLKIEADTSLQAITIADSNKLRNGDVVLAIGNPFGVGKTATMGIVSATGRNDLGISIFESFIQTDAAINPGNSGGALVNVKGELVGINSAIFSRTGSYQGIGFAAPSNQVVKVSNSLITGGEVIRGWLGVSIRTVHHKKNNSSLTEVMGLFPGGPAEEVGLLPGDVLLSINQETIGDASSAQGLISGKKPDEKIHIQVQRDDQILDFDAIIGTRPKVNQR